MNKKLIIAMLAFFGFTIVSSYAQETRFFMPLEIKKAYEKGTRSYDGKPGKNYWHNTVDYNIKVTVVPAEKLIEGYEEVVYYNNSSDEINTLVLHLYMDVYKKGNPRRFWVYEKDITSGVELAGVVINGVDYDLNNREMVNRSSTNISFTLKEPLKPGGKLEFKTSWKQKIPTVTRIRTGAYDSSSFFTAFWYPQVAVYDDIFGWDELNYTFMTEFYNNLGNYDVEITAPNEFIVWATGTLENAIDVLPEHIYIKYLQAGSSSEVVNIVSDNDLKNDFKTLNNTWHYIATEVPDFAFALSDHYLWDAAMQTIDERQVFISSAHPIDTTGKFSEHIAIQQKAMKHFSEDMPGIPYPYEAFTTFINNRSGGMEFPMMANNGRPNRRVTVHEMFHTYMSIYVRTNERRWAWMDEGWAVYNTEIVESRYFENDYKFTGFFKNVGPKYSYLGTIVDLPLVASSEFLTMSNYMQASYSVPALVYGIIHHHLGEEQFLKCYREYIKRWSKKSPTPYDFFYTFENVSGQDLSWLWKPWFFEFGYADVAIQSFEKNELIVINPGNKPVPLFIEVNYKNGESKLISESAHIWANGKNECRVTIPDYQNVELISVNTMVTDANLIDNFFPSIRSTYKEFDTSAELMGQYIIDESSVNISIKKEDGLIYYKSNYGRGVSEIIYPKDKFRFCSLDGTMNLKFNMDHSGRCISVDIYLNGSIINAWKQE